MTQLQVGDFQIDHVLDGSARFKPHLTFPDATDEQWAAHADLLDADGLLPFTMGGFLLRCIDRTVLVDLGLGPGELMGIRAGSMLDNLGALGVEPGDVTDVVFTHLHIDHIGWASQNGSVTFPNATYRCAAPEWDHFMVHHRGSEADVVQPAADRFEQWDGDTNLLPGIDTLSTPGHTPGSTTLVLSSGTERLMFLGDVVHCPVQLEDDEWGALFDVDPDLARRTRVALAREVEGTDTRVSGAHFPELTFGRLVQAQGRRRFVV